MFEFLPFLQWDVASHWFHLLVQDMERLKPPSCHEDNAGSLSPWQTPPKASPPLQEGASHPFLTRYLVYKPPFSLPLCTGFFQGIPLSQVKRFSLQLALVRKSEEKEEDKFQVLFNSFNFYLPSSL